MFMLVCWICGIDNVNPSWCSRIIAWPMKPNRQKQVQRPCQYRFSSASHSSFILPTTACHVADIYKLIIYSNEMASTPLQGAKCLLWCFGTIISKEEDAFSLLSVWKVLITIWAFRCVTSAKTKSGHFHIFMSGLYDNRKKAIWWSNIILQWLVHLWFHEYIKTCIAPQKAAG